MLIITQFFLNRLLTNLNVFRDMQKTEGGTDASVCSFPLLYIYTDVISSPSSCSLLRNSLQANSFALCSADMFLQVSV